ncbi:MAG: VWA domain-containing protein [Bacteroidetes bacterium]|nr:MAG: VWA domain-containing protein [Bacteroidota bacterium]TAG86114.1 MAG: VWA domain-containing protein [Bacteroidota bacterium]
MDFNVETPNNYEQKCLCVLVLDVSGSMDGEPIKQLNQGMQSFYQDIKENSTTANRLEVCLIEFASSVNVLIEPSLIENFTMPNLTTKGSTALVDGVRKAINKVEERKNWYKQTKQKYYRPWIILITDGEPDSNQDVDGLAQEIKQGITNKTFFFFGVGVEGARMEILEQISDTNMPPAMLQGLKFSEFFKWLSASMSTVTSSKDGDTISMASPASWMKGFTI